MTFRFLHLADVHLDAPFAARAPELRRELRAAGREAITRAVDLALAERVHAVLIAGDLFDGDNLSLDTERFLGEELARLSEARMAVIHVTGNHDPGGPGSRVRRVPWPRGFHLIAGRRPVTVDVADAEGRLIGRVTGIGHETAREATNLVAALPHVAGDDASVPHVALVHAWVQAAEAADHDRYAPCAVADFAGKGYAYWALGHIHKRQQVAARPAVWYPGNPQGRNPKETGEKGALLVEIDGEGEAAAARVRFVRLGPLRWETWRVDGLEAVDHLEAFKAELVRRLHTPDADAGALGPDCIVRVVPAGPCPLAPDLARDLADPDSAARLEDDLARALGVRAVELRPEGLVRPVDVEALERRGPSPLAEALALWRAAAADDEILDQLAPAQLAGLPAEVLAALPPQEALERRRAYLRELLQGLDQEMAARFAAGNG
ncbi:MAG: DNA repair exonuclease [Clostridia bacterium]|nr:DNA repair exonuclease [Clostridia bacterium]